MLASQLSGIHVLTARSDFIDFSVSSCVNFDLRNVLMSSYFIVVKSDSHDLGSFARKPYTCAFCISTHPTLAFETFEPEWRMSLHTIALFTMFDSATGAPFLGSQCTIVVKSDTFVLPPWLHFSTSRQAMSLTLHITMAQLHSTRRRRRRQQPAAAAAGRQGPSPYLRPSLSITSSTHTFQTLSLVCPHTHSLSLSI